MKSLLLLVWASHVNAQCGCATVAASTCTPCSVCETPTCFQTCQSACPAAPVAAVAPPCAPPPTCAGFTCPADMERTSYSGDCAPPLCTPEICCKALEGCEAVTAPPGWVKKSYSTCSSRCRMEDCYDQHPTCQQYSCRSGKKFPYPISCPGGCSDEICCAPDTKPHTCSDWLAHKSCNKYEAPRPDARCSGESCTQRDCCVEKPPSDCSNVRCQPGYHSSPQLICGKDRCTEVDCCTPMRTCSTVQCGPYHKKTKRDGCGSKDCQHDDCCEMGKMCRDFNCESAIKKHDGPCVGECNKDQCCKEPPIVNTVMVPGPPPPPVFVPGPPAPPVYSCATCGAPSVASYTTCGATTCGCR